MGGPQGAEVIIPVPLQGWFCSTHNSYEWLGRYKNSGFLFPFITTNVGQILCAVQISILFL